VVEAEVEMYCPVVVGVGAMETFVVLVVVAMMSVLMTLGMMVEKEDGDRETGGRVKKLRT